ncbi:MAG: A/G-specific adenine glycosylase [Acidobacteria bacterium]|nr:A/G-specific adenine glycosylase [Acidobacteriota bacterium]
MRRNAVIASSAERWFQASQRPLPWRVNYEPWHVWVAEVMAQQTRIEVVASRFPQFIERFPSPESLALADDDDVLTAWSGLGYYRRARMLRAGAIRVVEQFGGELPRRLEDLRSIPGIGEYTAGAIASTAFDQSVPAVDGNVMRLLARIEALEPPWRSARLGREATDAAREIVEAASSPRMLNQALMELGATICKPREPSCVICPLQTECRAFELGRAADYPRPAPRKSRKSLEIPLLVVTDDAGRVLMLRSEQGSLMTGLWHLPHGVPDLIPETAIASWTSREVLGTFRHSVTDRRITFVIHRADLDCRLGEGFAEAAWQDPEEDLATPSYVAKAFRHARLRDGLAARTLSR